MKKILSVLLAAVTAGALAVPSFAASSVNVTRDLTELSGDPIDEDGKQITGDTIVPGQTVYFMLPGQAGKILSNTKNFKLTAKKTKNAKMVKKISLVEKKLSSSSGTYSVPNGFSVNETLTRADSSTYLVTKPETLNNVSATSRQHYIAVQLNDTTSTDEIKVEMTLTFTARRAANPATAYNFSYGTGSSSFSSASNPFTQNNKSFLASPLAATGDKLNLKLNFYVSNPTDTGDTTITVGNAGVTIKPVKNDDNEVVFEGPDDTLATLYYKASSNPDKFYAKLSTKWTSDLLSKFSDTDAVIRRFTPANISSTSRATLALNNPYDTDEVSPSKVYIYTVNSKGVLSNITSQVKYNRDDDTFELLTRTLGTYIISNKKIRV